MNTHRQTPPPEESGLFSTEELALMASTQDTAIAEPDASLAALEARVREMARLVAEGFERERLLRRAAGGDKPDSALDHHANALLDAMKQLADLLAAGATREVILRQAGTARGAA